MNKKLKFSWGHIVAFLALIFISYVSFMGDFYKNGGNFKESIIKVLIIDIALLIIFIGAQILKGTDRKFERSIKFERFLILLTPIIFIITMIFNNDFWSVHKQKDNIENLFNSSISDARKMFEEYDSYSNKRIANYSDILDNVVRNKGTKQTTYTQNGFNGSNDQVRKDNYIHTLQIQLFSQNSIELQAEAKKWLSKANKGVSVWNAFLIGNIEHISNAIKDWNKELIQYSTPVLSNETLGGNIVTPFDFNKSSSERAVSNLNKLTDIYKEPGRIRFKTILLSPLLFLMLLFPYLLQKRDGKAHGIYYLIPRKRKEDEIIPIIEKKDNNKNETPSDDNNPFAGTF